MLLEFTVENFKSIKDRTTFSLFASSEKFLEEKNVANILINAKEKTLKPQKVLKTAVIYGANASGKSNILKAMSTIRKIIINSNKHIQGQEFPIDPFRLDLECLKKPTYFEFVFVLNKIKYSYQVSLTRKKVIEEKLYYWPNGRQIAVFERKEGKIEFSNQNKQLNNEEALRNKIYAEDTAKNVLFLSMANKVNIAQIKAVFNWFSQKLIMINRQVGMGANTTRMLADHKIDEKEVLKYLKLADPQIIDFSLTENKVENLDENHPMNIFIKTVVLPDIARRQNIKIDEIPGNLTGVTYKEKTKRFAYDKNNQKVLVDFDMSDESDGTQKYYGLTGTIITCLKLGCTLFYDELEMRLHPLLLVKLIELFTSDLNKNNAQLVITAHNTVLLDKNLYRRDQIWFTEKNDKGGTELYSLYDFQGVRPSFVKSKNYLKGKFGAIPDLEWSTFDE